MHWRVLSWLFCFHSTSSCTNKIINSDSAQALNTSKSWRMKCVLSTANLCCVAPCVSVSGPLCRREKAFQLLAAQSKQCSACMFARWFFTIAKLERADCVIIRVRACECAYLQVTERANKRERVRAHSRQITKVNAIVCFINPFPLYARKRNCLCSRLLCVCEFNINEWSTVGADCELAFPARGKSACAYLLVQAQAI
jgi:hypothetical protein